MIDVVYLILFLGLIASIIYFIHKCKQVKKEMDKIRLEIQKENKENVRILLQILDKLTLPKETENFIRNLNQKVSISKNKDKRDPLNIDNTE